MARDTGPVTSVEGDFEAFVIARFAELDAVAAVTTGEPVDAVELTAAGLATVADRWAELTAAGTPTSAARTAVLTRSLATVRSTEPSTTAHQLTRHDSHDSHASHDGEASATRSALTAVLLAAPATARAALAAGHFWDETPALVAACARVDTDRVVAELDALMQALSSAHATALGRDADELGWALPAAVADTLEHLAETSPVSDPVALVATARARAARRRRTRAGTLVAVVVLTVAVAAAVALAWPNPVPGIAAPTLPPEAPQWSSITSWAPRGHLVGDPAVTALAAARAGDPDARLLFAGTVGDTTVMLMTGTPTQTQPAGVLDPRVVPGPDIAPLHLSLWTAPAHRGPAALTPTRIEGDDSARSSDVVALSIEQDAAGAPPVVLVLTRPTVTEGFARTGARPDPDGRIRTLVQPLKLTGGVAMFTQNPGYPTTIAVAGFTGPPAGVVPGDDRLPERGSADDLASAQRALLAAVADYPVGALDTPAARDTVVDIPNPDAGILGADPGDVHVTVVSTVTADGGWVRTSRLSATSEDSGGQNMEVLAAVPASDHSHALLPVGDMRRPTFVALAPDAATAQLVTTDGQLRDSATVKDGLAILTSTQDPITATFRLRLLAPDGHIVYDDVPPTGLELLD